VSWSDPLLFMVHLLLGVRAERFGHGPIQQTGQPRPPAERRGMDPVDRDLRGALRFASGDRHVGSGTDTPVPEPTCRPPRHSPAPAMPAEDAGLPLRAPLTRWRGHCNRSRRARILGLDEQRRRTIMGGIFGADVSTAVSVAAWQSLKSLRAVSFGVV